MNPASIAAASITADLSLDSDMTPLERLHAAQRRQLLETGGIHSAFFSGMGLNMNNQLIPLRGKCIPGKIDLPAVVSAVNHNASQLAHRGTNGGRSSSAIVPSGREYGDPNSTPVVFVSDNGDIQIALSVEGITCAHCVKIVETVLKGCNGNKSPIDGLLDAAADQVLCKVLIKIDLSSNAKRVAFEAARNLAMVGYTAKAHEMSIVNEGGDRKATVDLGALSTAFEVVASTDPQDMFDWSTPCACPDSGIMRHDCSRFVPPLTLPREWYSVPFRLSLSHFLLFAGTRK
jgi:copper chaperone CopZ